MHTRSIHSPRPHLPGLVLALIAGSCASAPPIEPPAPLTIESRSFPGSTLSGPVFERPQLEQDPWPVDVRIACVPVVPAPSGEPLSRFVRHVLVEPRGEPLGLRTELGAGVRVVLGADALAGATWEQRRLGALWPGSSASWRTASNPVAEDPPRPSWDALALTVSRPRDGAAPVELTLSFEGDVVPASEEDDAPEQAAAPERTVELVVLDLPADALQHGVRFVLPAPRRGLPRAAQVLELRVGSAWDGARPGLAEARVRGLDDIERSLARAGEASAALDPQAAFELERRRALEALERDRLQRSALLFLAGATDAEPTAEVALVVSDPTLADLLVALRDGLAQLPTAPESADDFGWFLERVTYRWLARRALDPAVGLEPELHAALLRHAGELGRYPDLVLETVARCSGQADLRLRIQQENQVFLEDSHPAARVRAYDWLKARGLAPADYDPLGTLEQRRRAIAARERAADGSVPEEQR